MKKICFSTLGCTDYSLEEIVTLAKKYNVDALEVRGIGGEMDNTKIQCFLPENAEKTKAYLKENGIELLSMGTSACCDAIGDNDGEIKKICDEIDVASRMGFKFVRVFGNSIKEDYDVVLSRVVRALTKLCRYAKDKNVDVLLETHGDFNDEATVNPVIEQMKEFDNFGLIWDIMHTDGKYKENWLKFYEAQKPYIRHLHIKDHERSPWKLVNIGEGNIPVADICNYLEKDGYEGYFSLEWERKWHPELCCIEEAMDSFLKTVN